VDLDMILRLIKIDLTGRQCLPMIALSAMLLGTLSTGVAAIFDDIALDKAISLARSILDK